MATTTSMVAWRDGHEVDAVRWTRKAHEVGGAWLATVRGAEVAVRNVGAGRWSVSVEGKRRDAYAEVPATTAPEARAIVAEAVLRGGELESTVRAVGAEFAVLRDILGAYVEVTGREAALRHAETSIGVAPRRSSRRARALAR